MKKIQAFLLTLLLSLSHLTKATDPENCKVPVSSLYDSEEDLDLEKIDACLDYLVNYDNCITIDKMIKKKKNQHCFFENETDDVVSIIFSFALTETLALYSLTSRTSYTLVNQFDRRHELFKTIGLYELNKILELKKTYPKLKESKTIDSDLNMYDSSIDCPITPIDEGIQAIVKLSKDFSAAKNFTTSQLREITDENTVRFIMSRPILKYILFNNLSFSEYLLDLLAKKTHRACETLTPFDIPLSAYLKSLKKVFPYYPRLRSFLEVPSMNEAKKIAFLAENVAPYYEYAEYLFLCCLDTLPSAVLRMGEYSFYSNATSVFLRKIIKNEDLTSILFGILAQKYPSAESINTTDKRGLDCFLRICKKQIREYIYNTELFGEMAYFIKDRNLKPNILDEYVDDFKGSRECILNFASSLDIESISRQELLHLAEIGDGATDIQANLTSYASLSMITTAYTAFLAYCQQKSESKLSFYTMLYQA